MLKTGKKLRKLWLVEEETNQDTGWSHLGRLGQGQTGMEIPTFVVSLDECGQAEEFTAEKGFSHMPPSMQSRLGSFFKVLTACCSSGALLVLP